MRRFYRTLFGRFPWWVVMLLGVAAVVLGAAITLKPFSSLGVLIALVAVSFVLTGIAELGSAETTRSRVVAVAWIAAGIAVAVWPGLSISGLAIFVGIVLLVGGIVRVVAGFRGEVDDRLIAVVSGLARVIFGVLALSWPDVTVLVVALFVGPAMILFGIGQVASGIRQRHAPTAAPGSGGHRWPNRLRIVGVSASLLFALGLLAVSGLVHDSSAEPGAFYDAPNSVPSERGMLLRDEPFTTAVPAGARAWKILYTTTRDDRTPAVASAVVLVSTTAPPGPRPVIAWAHGTTGYAPKCAPSLVAKGLDAGAMPAMDTVVANGWVLVATDYVGLGTEGPHPYLIGDPEGRSVLDAVLAARHLDGVDLQDRTVVWGHSQGGGAALWTGIIAPTYAPDANVIGVAALAPATELAALFDGVKDEPVGKVMGSYAMSAYSATYPDVKFDDYIRPEARTLAHETADRCLSGPEVLFSVGTALGTGPWFSKNPADGPLGERLEENVPLHPIRAPLLIGQGAADPLVRPAVQQRYVDQMCAAGQRLEYRTYAGYDHVGVVTDADSPLIPDLLRWTQDRLDGKLQPPGCKTVTG